MFGTMFTDFNWGHLFDGSFLKLGLTIADYVILLAGTVLLTGVSLLNRRKSVRERIAAKPLPLRFVLWYGLFLIILIFGVYGIGYESSQFIYNQF